jgi:hypothetical protein
MLAQYGDTSGIRFPDGGADSFSFDYNASSGYKLIAKFTDGTQRTVNYQPAVSNLDAVFPGHLSYEAPPGKLIDSLIFKSSNGAEFFLDNISWGNESKRSFAQEEESNSHSIEDIGGISTLSIAVDDETIDLAQISGEHRLLVIDMTGAGDNTLKLSVNDILSNGEADLFHDSGMQQLKIEGNEGDLVDLQGLLGTDDPGQWASQGQITSGGKVYEVYQHSAGEAELLIEQGVQTNLV